MLGAMCDCVRLNALCNPSAQDELVAAWKRHQCQRSLVQIFADLGQNWASDQPCVDGSDVTLRAAPISGGLYLGSNW